MQPNNGRIYIDVLTKFFIGWEISVFFFIFKKFFPDLFFGKCNLYMWFLVINKQPVF